LLDLLTAHDQQDQSVFDFLAYSSGQVAAKALGRVPTNISRNQRIFEEGEPAEFLYCLERGAVRTFKLLSDGRRQIAAFPLPGDFFGFELGETHNLAAEAVVQSCVVRIKRHSLDGRPRPTPGLLAKCGGWRRMS
jgi:CRP/FNR family nitrogen fixation transcriptional regulator